MSALTLSGQGKPSRRGLAVLVWLCAILVAAWLAGRAAERWALSDLRRGARSAIGLQVGVLLAEMQKQASLPLALAADPEVAAAVGPDPGRDLLDRVDRRLAQVAAATGSAVIYVIRADGLTVAASNAGRIAASSAGTTVSAPISSRLWPAGPDPSSPWEQSAVGRACTSRAGSGPGPAWWW